MKEHPNYWRAVKASQPFQQLDFFLLFFLLYLHLCKQFIFIIVRRLFVLKLNLNQNFSKSETIKIDPQHYTNMTTPQGAAA